MAAFQINSADQNTLKHWHNELSKQFEEFKAQGLSLDLTRGKPSSEQLTLSNKLDGILDGNYKTTGGTDTRNYGGLDGLTEAKELFAKVLQVEPSNLLVGGNSSLTLMYQSILFAYLFGFNGKDSAWENQETVKFLCPVPGYDRHFSICEEFNIEMLTVPMNDNGPDMDQVEQLIKNDSSIRGMWCVPRFSNPTGTVYSDATVERIAKLGLIADKNFRVFWDNAYAIHHIESNAPTLAAISAACKKHGTEDSLIQFGSTSKVTMAGAGVAYMSSSSDNLAMFKKHLGMASIGPDKINQLRHIAFFQDENGLSAHMQKHANLLKPRFDSVLSCLNNHFSDSDALCWTIPKGGYFVSVDTQDGLAQEVVKMAAACGVKLTPAGATFPYGKDPRDKNIRLAPSFPTVEDIILAMEIFACCVKLASVNKAMN